MDQGRPNGDYYLETGTGHKTPWNFFPGIIIRCIIQVRSRYSLGRSTHIGLYVGNLNFLATQDSYLIYSIFNVR
jgi:hypothetical protein